MNRNFVVRCAPLIGALLLVADVSPLHLAHGQTWKLATGGDWGNANNWKNPAAVPDNGATVIFPDGLAGNAAIGIGQQYTVNSLELISTSQFAYTLQASAVAGTLKFVNNNPAITVDADNTAQHTISVPLSIDANAGLTFTNNSMVPLSVSSPIGGNNVGSVVFASGTIALSGTSTYVGVNDIRSAVVSITKNAALGDSTSPVTIAFGGTLQGVGGGATLSANRTVKLAHFAGDDVDSFFSGDDVNANNIFQIDSMITNDKLTFGKPNVSILYGVRLTNAANDFTTRDFIYLGGSGVDGRLYLSNDGALGNAANKISFESGKITAEDTFTSAREIDLSNIGVFSVNANKTLTLSGNIVDGQQLTKQGPGTLVLGGANTYTLITRIEAGTLAFSADANLGNAGARIVMLDGSTLRATAAVTTPRNIALGPTSSTIETAVAAGSSVRVDGVVSGGQLVKSGGGNLFLTNANNTFSSSRVADGGLKVNSDAPLGAAGGSVSLGGDGFLFATDTFTSDRPIKLLTGSSNVGIAVADGKTLTLSSGINGPNNFSKFSKGTLVLDNGSTSSIGLAAFIGSGTLDISGSFETAQGLFNFKGSKLEGKGTIKGMFNNQGRVKPGKSPGTLTVDGPVQFEPDAEFQIDINAATGTAGGDLGWGLLDSTGVFQTSGPVAVALDSLLTSGDPGSLMDFNPSQTYQWEILQADGGISGFQPTDWTVDSSQFLNPTLPSYGFSVEQQGSSLFLDYGPLLVPEPSALLLCVLATVGVVTLTAIRQRRRQGQLTTDH
jgi:autotransporter-associated beta strand protein